MKRKEKNIIKIGEDFIENNKITQEYYTEFKTLGECYGKWSDAKENVFNYYYNLLRNNSDNVIDYGIRSYNCNYINLHAVIEKAGKKLYLLITPAHNWCKEV